jgi:hypothetical protein
LDCLGFDPRSLPVASAGALVATAVGPWDAVLFYCCSRNRRSFSSEHSGQSRSSAHSFTPSFICWQFAHFLLGILAVVALREQLPRSDETGYRAFTAPIAFKVQSPICLLEWATHLGKKGNVTFCERKTEKEQRLPSIVPRS